MDNKKDIMPNRLYRYCCRKEVWLSLAIIAAVLSYALWPLFMTPNSFYPTTVDGMGHLCKVEYIADCVREMKWPAWFPYWYNGSTVVQYYPPLSYLTLLPVQLAFDNIMITFKFFGFFSLFIGAMGVWQLCHKFIGPWVGIWAGIIYVVDPFLTRSLFLSGVIAQGPIFALSPWFLYFSLLLFKDKSRLRWLAVSVIIAMLILSQAMHAFMIAIITAVIGLALLVLRSINMKDFLLWAVSVAFGAALVSFWWIPGVTQWENPGIPYLLSEAVKTWTAKIDWFTLTSRNSSWLYFAFSFLVIALLALLLSQILRKRNAERERNGETGISYDLRWFYSIVFGLLFSVIFSFGYQIPGFRYIPMHENLVAGRILSFSVCLAAIVSAYFLSFCIRLGDKGFRRIIGIIIIIAGMALVLIDIDPRQISFPSSPYRDKCEDLNFITDTERPSMNGRFAWVMPVNSEMAYFPMIKKLYMTDGWNIEGTPHNRAIWQHNIAIQEECNDYVVRNLLLWNTRSAFVSNKYDLLIEALQGKGFHIRKKDGEKTILFNPAPSSYFLRQERNALVIGKAAINLEMHFPWMLRGYSAALEDYTEEYLSAFKLIYLIEPEVKDFKRFQQLVEELAAGGKMVIISMGREETWPLLDIIPYWEKIADDSRLETQANAGIEGEAWLEADPAGQVPAMGNLDETWAIMQGEDKDIPAIGYKEINGKRVYFVGLAIGQLLDSKDGKQLRMLLEQLMDLAQPNKSINPQAFPIIEDEWSHDGFSFSYDSLKPEPVLVSVTYTPRWRASLDGKPLPVQNMDNLISIELPAGKHQVSFHYAMTWVGKLGLALSLLSLLIVLLCYRYFDKFDLFYERLKEKFRRYVSLIGE